MPPAVSLITVYYNMPEDLLRLARSIRKFLHPDLYEHIIVDNASQENLSAELSGALYTRLDSNEGFGRACNHGAGKASAPALFFVNPDCELVEDCVTPLLAALQRTAVCGPRVIYPDGALQLSFGPFLSIRNEALQRRRMLEERSPSVQSWIRQQGAFEPDYVSGCALMVRADVFRQAGGFDKNFFLYHEDVDLCKRIRELGHHVLYTPSTSIVHEKNRSVQKTPDRVRVEYRKSQLYYYKKHHGWLQNAILRLYLAGSRKGV
ncbi:MAG TPA: glycosyltransferase family 2 protein [Acidobacteriota bacterium]|nr:glycosyltransferase family 2 protein [Acidobacteriota bacterium]